MHEGRRRSLSAALFKSGYIDLEEYGTEKAALAMMIHGGLFAIKEMHQADLPQASFSSRKIFSSETFSRSRL